MNDAKNGEQKAGDPYLLGDHLALDLINTQANLNGHIHEFWTTDDDIVRWLDRVGVVSRNGAPAAAVAGILDHAKQLRDVARALILQRKRSGVTGDPAALNRFLRACQTYPQLVLDDSGARQLVRCPVDNSQAQLLGQVAEAVATLLAEGDFDLVKECEHPECVMWFYDRTKAHKRRWCSMALCGNRHKAAQFRKRSAALSA